MNDLCQTLFLSKLGPFYLTASKTGLCGVFRKRPRLPMAESLAGASHGPQIKILAEAKKQLEEYFAGNRREFDLPLDMDGTPFQKAVWKELKRIPFGTTCSYGDIARKIKNRRAVRAVGGANGKNPLCIIVPCHRVIASDGSLGGYSGGLDLKRALLQHEQSVEEAGLHLTSV